MGHVKRKAVASEMILTIGVLIAVGIALIQIKSVFYSEEKLSQQDLVNQFAKDIESVIDKSSSVTGNATFTYKPQIKKYTFNVSSFGKKTIEKKEISLAVLKSKLVKEIDKQLQTQTASVRKDVCEGKEIYGESSFQADISNIDLDAAIKKALKNDDEFQFIDSYSIKRSQKITDMLEIDFCNVVSTEISYYDYVVNFKIQDKSFDISSMDIYSSSFGVSYEPGHQSSLEEGEEITFSQMEFTEGPINKFFKQKDVKIQGPAVLYWKSKIFLQNLDYNTKECRAGIYCNGQDCGGIAFGHFTYILGPGQKATLNLYPTVETGDFIIFCDDGSYMRKTIDFRWEMPETPIDKEKDEKIIGEIAKSEYKSKVTISDKLSGSEASFVSQHNVAESYFEDSETIRVIKNNNIIYILGDCLKDGRNCVSSMSCCSDLCWGDNGFICQQECAPNGKKSVDSQSCCSKFLNETTGLCDEPPFCPKDKICPGAPESVEVGGEDCCKGETPVCTNGHCCPSDKTKWCRYPKSGQARCMSDSEYEKDCDKPENIYVVSLVPAFYSDVSSFQERVKVMKEFTEGVLPFKENPATLVVLTGNENCQLANEGDSSSLKRCGNELARKNGYPAADITGGIFGICVGGDGCSGILGYTMPGEGWFIAGHDICSTKGCPSKLDAVIVPHEIGHNFRLCEGYCYQGGHSCYAPEKSSFGGYCGTSRIEQKFPYSRSASGSAPCGGCGPSVCCKGRILDNDPENGILGGRDIMGPGSAGSQRDFACDSYLAFKEVAINVFNFDLPTVTNIDIEECYNHIKGDTYP